MRSPIPPITVVEGDGAAAMAVLTDTAIIMVAVAVGAIAMAVVAAEVAVATPGIIGGIATADAVDVIGRNEERRTPSPPFFFALSGCEKHAGR